MHNNVQLNHAKIPQSISLVPRIVAAIMPGQLFTQAFDGLICRPNRIGHKSEFDQGCEIAIVFKNLDHRSGIPNCHDFKSLLQQLMHVRQVLKISCKADKIVPGTYFLRRFDPIRKPQR